jgi:large conductance mechanosensitive channel
MKKKMQNFWSEFKIFISRGNVMNLAIGVIIGSAFSEITKSLVADILSPLIGCFTQADLSGWAFSIGPDAQIRYGAFLSAIINFLILAFVVFLLTRALNKLTSLAEKAKDIPPDPPTTKTCPYCISEIPIAAARCPHCTSHLEPAE